MHRIIQREARRLLELLTAAILDGHVFHCRQETLQGASNEMLGTETREEIFQDIRVAFLLF